MLKLYKNVSILIPGRKPTLSSEFSYLGRRLVEFSAGIGGVKFNLERSPGMQDKHPGAIYTKSSAICQKDCDVYWGKQLVFLHQPHVSCFSSTATSHASFRTLGAWAICFYFLYPEHVYVIVLNSSWILILLYQRLI